MSVFIASVIVLLIAMAYSFYFNRTLAETIFLSLVSIILILYCFGLLNFRGCLAYGVGFVIIFSLLCLLYVINSVLHKKKTLHTIKFLSGLFLYLGILVAAYYFCFNINWIYGDEFSYWGIAVKHMYLFNAFTTVPADIGYITVPEYFPGTSILNYFFTRFSLTFSEYPSYIALFVLYFSSLLPVVSHLGKKKIINVLLLLIIFTVLPVATNSEFTCYLTLSTDYFLGCLFGITLITYFALREDNRRFHVILITAMLSLLTLTKDFGGLLAIFVIIVIALDLIFSRKIKKNANFNYLLSPLLFIIFIEISWKFTTRHIQNSNSFISPTITDILHLIRLQLKPDQIEIVNQFLDVLSKPITPMHFSIIQFSICFFLIAMLMAFINKKINFFESFRSATALLCCMATFEFILLVMYVFSFYAKGQIGNPSFERYNGTMILGLASYLSVHVVFCDFSIVNQFGKINLKHFPQVIASVLIVFLLCLNLAPSIYRDIIHVRENYSNRYIPRQTSLIDKWKPYILNEPNNSSLYVVSQIATGWWTTRMLSVGELYPDAQVNVASAAPIGTMIYDDLNYYFMKEVIFTPEEWETHILSNKFTLLYTYIIDDRFVESYGQFFPNGVQQDMLYRVHIENGHMALIPVTQS